MSAENLQFPSNFTPVAVFSFKFLNLWTKLLRKK